MRISDHAISEITQGVDDRLSLQGSTDVSDMRRLADIHADIVNDDGLMV